VVNDEFSRNAVLSKDGPHSSPNRLAGGTTAVTVRFESTFIGAKLMYVLEALARLKG
jgi:hypothetical protein